MAQKAVNKWAEDLKVYKVLLQYVVKMFEFAINLKMVKDNPFKNVIRPKTKDADENKDIKFYTLEEVQKLCPHLIDV